MSKGTILIIDDEPDVLTLLDKGLSCSGFAVIQASNGKLGIDLALQHQPDVILLDINMPGLSGTEVLDVLKSCECTATIPVIMLTALSDRELVLKSIIDEAFAYLEKPYNHTALVALVEDALAACPGEVQTSRLLV